MFEPGPMNLAVRSDAFLLATFLLVGLGLFGWDVVAFTRFQASWNAEWLGAGSGKVKYFFLYGSLAFPVAAFAAGGVVYVLYGLLFFATTNGWPPADHYWYSILAFNGALFVLGFVLLVALVQRQNPYGNETGHSAVHRRRRFWYVGYPLAFLELCGFAFTIRDLIQFASNIAPL